jgi:hypothetical protein
MSSIAMRRFTAGPSVRGELHHEGELGDLGLLILIECLLAFKGIEAPDENFLFDQACRCVVRTSCRLYLLSNRILKHESSHTRRCGQRKLRPSLATSTRSLYVHPAIRTESIIDESGRITNMMLSSSVPVDQVCEQRLVLPRLVSTLPVYPSSSQLDLTR